MYRVLGNILADLDPKFKGQIMYIHVNGPPPKPLNVATPNYASV